MKLTFTYNTGTKCSYEVALNGEYFNGCDINFDQKYTQAHIVIAKASKVSSIPVDEIELEINSKDCDVNVYPLETLRSMANVYKPFIL